MTFFNKRSFATATTIALLTASFTLSPINISTSTKGVEISNSTAQAASSSWEYVTTKKTSTGAKNALTVATAAGLGALLGISVPYSVPLSSFGVIILDKSLKTVYFKDRISMRMYGGKFQNKHEITMYTDSSYTKKTGKTITIIETVSAGPR